MIPGRAPVATRASLRRWLASCRGFAAEPLAERRGTVGYEGVFRPVSDLLLLSRGTEAVVQQDLLSRSHAGRLERASSRTMRVRKALAVRSRTGRRRLQVRVVNSVEQSRPAR